MNLSDIQKGSSYLVTKIDQSDDILTSKILALGLIPGETVALMHIGPMGDPMQIKVGNSYLQIRKIDSQYINVIPKESINSSNHLQGSDV